MKCPLHIDIFFTSRVVDFSTTKGMVDREDVKGEKVWVSGLSSGESVFAPFCVRVGGTGAPICQAVWERAG